MFDVNKIREAVKGILNSYFEEELEEEEEEVPVEELILLTHPQCQKSHELKQKIDKALKEGWIREVNILSEEGKVIADSINSHETPILVAKLPQGYVRCKYWFEGEDLVFDLDLGKKKRGRVEEGKLLDTLLEDYSGIAITCLDPYIKNSIVTVIFDRLKGNVNEWYYNNVARPLLALSECPHGKFIGYGEVKKKKRRRRKKRISLNRLGIVGLCREAKQALIEELERYGVDTEKVKQLKECDLIAFAEVDEGERMYTPYQEHMKKCMAELKHLPVRERFKECALRWRKIKDSQST